MQKLFNELADNLELRRLAGIITDKVFDINKKNILGGKEEMVYPPEMDDFKKELEKSGVKLQFTDNEGLYLFIYEFKMHLVRQRC